MKLKEGDILMVLGPAHFEKAEITKAEKGIYTLNNGLKIDSNLQILGGTSRFKVKPFEQSEYDYHLALNSILRLLQVIRDNYKNLSSENVLKIKDKLERITNKYM